MSESDENFPPSETFTPPGWEGADTYEKEGMMPQVVRSVVEHVLSREASRDESVLVDRIVGQIQSRNEFGPHFPPDDLRKTVTAVVRHKLA